VNAIGAARQEIMVQAYEMTSPQIKRALVAAERRGVKVEAIFDPSAVRETNTMVGELSDGGIPVFIDSAHSPGLAHNKVMIIDRTVVITGSFNFTKAAESRNAENLLIIQILHWRRRTRGTSLTIWAFIAAGNGQHTTAQIVSSPLLLPALPAQLLVISKINDLRRLAARLAFELTQALVLILDLNGDLVVETIEFLRQAGQRLMRGFDFDG
jgi:phosphatidylserine/phosphatidylglycerophosphate/cardiolipin synthase-like enzyme